MTRDDSFFYYPIFTTYCNNVPLTAELGIMEATHIQDLYYSYADKHNDHVSPYAEWHLDPLKCCICQYPDIEVFTFDDFNPQWYLGLDISHALHGAYSHALQIFGDALQPTNWDRHEPWLEYNYSARLAELGMPYIPKPATFQNGAYHLPFSTFNDLQRQVHHNNFYAMCLVATTYVINAVKMNHYHNLVYASYMRGSPGFVSAHHYWCCLNSYPVTDHSKDDQSTAGKLQIRHAIQRKLKFIRHGFTDFELLAQEQQQSLVALTPPTPSTTRIPMEEEVHASVTSKTPFNAAKWQDGAMQCDYCRSIPFARANIELMRSLYEQRDDINYISDVAAAGSPLVHTSNDLDLDKLLERLQGIATLQSIRELVDQRTKDAEPAWQWPIGTIDGKALMLPILGRLTLNRSSSPPMTWDNYWSTKQAKESVNMEVDMESTLAQHVILTPNVTVA